MFKRLNVKMMSSTSLIVALVAIVEAGKKWA